jgi:CHAT domain-containing protein/tetratricopeptide (TPR) repeat protein
VAVGESHAALHARAVVDLFAPDERGRALDRAIESLRALARTAERPAPVLGDLAAALIVRGERVQAPRDLLEAYEVARQALEAEPGNLSALYNRALALDRFGLADESARAWRAYLDADARSPWADQARRRLSEGAGALSSTPPPPAPDGPLADYAAYAAANPQAARELGMNRLLGEWGAAIQKSDTATAADRLRRASALGESLARPPGGDASLADAVRAIHSATGSHARLRALARAHQAYAEGMARYDSSEYAQAAIHLARAEMASSASPALRGWARLYLGTVHVHNHMPARGEQILRSVVAVADPARHPALAARALWSLGNTLGRTERSEKGLEFARESARLFGVARERENEGAVLNVVVHAHFVLGEPDSGYVAMHRALDRLRPFRASMRLRTFFTSGAPLVEADGLFWAALSLQNEGVAVAARNGGAIQIVESRATRARLLAARQLVRAALEDVRSARALLPGVRDAVVRGWLEADLREIDALLSLRSNPELATAAMDSSAEYFSSVPVRAFPYYVGGAEARLAAGDHAGAMTRLGRALRLLEQRRDSTRMEPRRAAVFDAARTVVDRIVMLKLAQGRTGEALDYMDRGRASLAAAGTSAFAPSGLPAAPSGETVVAYALIGDTLLSWTVSGSRVELFRSVVDAERLIRLIEEVEAMLERQAPLSEIHPRLSRLHDWLLRPVRSCLGAPGTPLVIVADGALAAVPFAALYDVQRARYLVQDHPLRHAVSLREAGRPVRAPTAPGVLLIADPAFSAREHPLLERLSSAANELRDVAAAYPGARVLHPENATRDTLLAWLPRTGVVHFAGHAVFEDERPERSFLVLAPGPDAPGRITAGELAELDLRAVRLVVLAACRTVGSGRGRAAGFTGLSGALLAAGAAGAVGSTWDVDDRLTASLMPEFHRRYHRSGDGPRALRDAQLALLRSSSPALRSPAAWAGFRYVGR